MRRQASACSKILLNYAWIFSFCWLFVLQSLQLYGHHKSQVHSVCIVLSPCRKMNCSSCCMYFWHARPPPTPPPPTWISFCIVSQYRNCACISHLQCLHRFTAGNLTDVHAGSETHPCVLRRPLTWRLCVWSCSRLPCRWFMYLPFVSSVREIPLQKALARGLTSFHPDPHVLFLQFLEEWYFGSDYLL